MCIISDYDYIWLAAKSNWIHLRVFVLIALEEVGQRWRATNTTVEHYRKGLKCERRVDRERERRIRELAPTKRRT
jgi:hypothetical protein